MKTTIKIGVLALLTISIQSCSLFNFEKDPKTAEPVTGELVTGAQVGLLDLTLPATGKVTIGSQGSSVSLEGMSIRQSGPAPSQISISAAEITSHSFGELINPVSALISIHAVPQNTDSPTFYEIVIPISEPVADDEFMMAFYYSPETGKLEGIPTTRYRTDELTISTSHFSDMFISKVKLALLPDKIFTGFKPEVDGWPFVNWGTAYNPEGICAGMSLTAMYAFGTKGGGLYAKADNDQNPGNSTPEFWQDDVNGIIFSNAAQNLYARFFYQWYSDFWLEGLDDAITYRCFAYSMAVTAEPQYVGIGQSGGTGGHAMVVYAIDENQLFVYDPNYPAHTARIINFKANTTGSFDPYNSGSDAEAIANGYGAAYDIITYASKTAILPYDQLEQYYGYYLSGNLHVNDYANKTLELVIKNEKDVELVRSKEQKIVVNAKNIKLAYNTTPNFSGRLGAYYYDSDFKRITDGNVTLDENKETIIGVNVVGKLTGESGYDWLGFKWFSLEYSELDPNLFGTWYFGEGDTYQSWTFNENGTAKQVVAGNSYDWNWIIEEGQIKLFLPNAKPAYYTYKIENGKLYLWVDSLNVWSLPFTKA
ncbi:DUF5640 domain-containing protein [Jiulongibacter sediminis]|uniref:Uncharacterized protein n=1 Tax=Jiulongibacter sediminis TaxID=1605367 RepID=A0A0P7BX87_9BACT|nr:DUF5640 domain-containing protein [Jiulongibacter sediminis]KPM49222.1 hypothetical protein AFM12_00895 [Jiulongibacter sediminis]TBX26277.1 hypothetical protein TK44_00895 [Jiulongibacter sediminis]